MNDTFQMRAWRAFLLVLGLCLTGAAPSWTGLAVAQDASPPDPDAPDSFSRLAKRLIPSVVNISTRQTISTSGMEGFMEDSPLEEFNEFFGREGDGLKRGRLCTLALTRISARHVRPPLTQSPTGHKHKQPSCCTHTHTHTPCPRTALSPRSRLS